MTATVRVQQAGDGYDVVLADEEALVLAHYDAADCGDCSRPQDGHRHARQLAERFAAQLRRVLRRTRIGR